jgi:tRNA 2-thiouridine synthesizing protein E
MSYQMNGTTIEHDEEGYIFEVDIWNKELAGIIAGAEDIDMTDEHWEVVDFLREYYDEYQIAPAIRVLVRAVKKSFGPEKGNNKYLYQLFPYGPAKQACKIAGLPKPTGCV